MPAITIHQTFLEKHASVEASLGEPLSISGLTGPLRLFQRTHGHRQSIDDTVTAYYALQKCPVAKEILDLGAGIGTVGLIVLWGLGEEARLTCIEAQDVSFKLLCANIECNGLRNRVTTIHGDLRDLHLEKRFLLITASPPYFSSHAGTIPKDSQKAYARFELRGHLGDYARAAKRHLQDDGLFVYCFSYQQKQRGCDLVTQEGLHLVAYRDVIPTKSSKPLFSVFAASPHDHGPTIEESPLIVQGEDGRYSEGMLAIQATRGFGPEGTNTFLPYHDP